MHLLFAKFMEIHINAIQCQLDKHTISTSAALSELESHLWVFIEKAIDPNSLAKQLPYILDHLFGKPHPWAENAHTDEDVSSFRNMFLPNGILVAALLKNHYMVSIQSTQPSVPLNDTRHSSDLNAPEIRGILMNQPEVAKITSQQSHHVFTVFYENEDLVGRTGEHLRPIFYLLAYMVDLVPRKGARTAEILFKIFQSWIPYFLPMPNWPSHRPSTKNLVNLSPNIFSDRIAGIKSVTPSSIARCLDISLFFAKRIINQWIERGLTKSELTTPTWESIGLYSEHVCQAFVKSRPAMTMASMSKLPANDALVMVESTRLADAIFKQTRSPWFKLLSKHIRLSSTQDPAFKYMLDVWCSFVSPWQSIGLPLLGEDTVTFGDFWVPFVENNGIIYDLLGTQLFETVYSGLCKGSYTPPQLQFILEALANILTPFEVHPAVTHSLRTFEFTPQFRDQLRAIETAHSDVGFGLFSIEFRAAVIIPLLHELLRVRDKFSTSALHVPTNSTRFPSLFTLWSTLVKRLGKVDQSEKGSFVSKIEQNIASLQNIFQIAANISESSEKSTLLPDTNVPRSLHLPGPNNVPSIRLDEAFRPADHVKSYEIAALIPYTMYLSCYVTRKWNDLAPPAHQLSRPISLRWLAVKQNVILLLIACIVWWLMVA